MAYAKLGERAKLGRQLVQAAGGTQALDGAAPVRPNLAPGAMSSEERERPPRHATGRDVEMDGHSPATAEVDAPRGPNDRRELDGPATRLRGPDRRELAPDVLGKAHRASSASSRRLYSVPSAP